MSCKYKTIWCVDELYEGIQEGIIIGMNIDCTAKMYIRGMWEKEEGDKVTKKKLEKMKGVKDEDTKEAVFLLTLNLCML